MAPEPAAAAPLARLAPGETACPQALDPEASQPSEQPGGPAFGPGPSCGEGGRRDVSYVFGGSDGGMVVADPADLFAFGALDGEAPRPMGDESVLNGVHMRVAQLTAQLSCDEVLVRYRQQLAANDVFPFYGEPQGPDGPRFLSFRPADSKVMKTLTLLSHGDEACEVFVSVGDPTGLDQPGKVPAEVPAPEGARDVTVNEVLDGPSRQSNIQYLIDKTPEEVRRFYEAELARQGFKPSGDVWAGDSTQLWRESYTRGQHSLALSIARPAELKATQVNIIYIHN